MLPRLAIAGVIFGDGSRSHRPHPLRSHASFALASATVCHCMFDTASGPPQASGTMWSFQYPGQAPIVLSLLGERQHYIVDEITNGVVGLVLRENHLARVGRNVSALQLFSKNFNDVLGTQFCGAADFDDFRLF
jgi:hypothetical protein